MAKEITDIPETNGLKIPTGAFLAQSAFIVMLATIISRILGLIREMATAHIYGASGNTDAFYLAFTIPELVRTLVISGVLSSVFIPIFADIAEKKGFEEAKRATTEIFTFTTLLAIVTCLLGIIFAPQVIWLAKKISFSDVEISSAKLAIELTRILFPMLIFMSLSGVMQSILNSLHDYKTPAFAPLIFNVTIIIPLILAKYINPTFENIHMLAYVTVLGIFLQDVIQIPALKRCKIRLFKVPDFQHEAFRKFWDLAPAAMLGYTTMVINTFVDKAIAYTLIPEGGLTTLWYGFRIQQIPYSVFGVTLVTVLFPTIAQHIAAERFSDLRRSLETGVRMLAFTVIPSSIYFMALSWIIADLLFGHGKFIENTDSIKWTSLSLKYYTFGIFPAISLLLVSRVFFSFHDTKTPLKAGIIMVIVNFCLAQVLGRYYGVKGLALATSTVAYLNLFILVLLLIPKVPYAWHLFFNRHLLKILIASVAQYFALVYMTYGIHFMLKNPWTIPSEMIVLVIGFVVSLIIFGGITVLLRCSEWRTLFNYLARNLLKNNRGAQFK